MKRRTVEIPLFLWLDLEKMAQAQGVTDVRDLIVRRLRRDVDNWITTGDAADARTDYGL